MNRKMVNSLGISDAVLDFGEKILSQLKPRFDAIDETAEYNQAKVLNAMQENRVSAACLTGTTGYLEFKIKDGKLTGEFWAMSGCRLESK